MQEGPLVRSMWGSRPPDPRALAVPVSIVGLCWNLCLAHVAASMFAIVPEGTRHHL